MDDVRQHETNAIVEIRRIDVRDGVLTVELTQDLIDRIRHHFGLLECQQIDDDHVRMYVYSAVNTAVNKAEHELANVRNDERT